MRRIILIFAWAIILSSCGSGKEITVPVDHTNYEVHGEGQGVQGTALIKVYSYGYTVDNAIEKAKMDAVHAVLFKGIPGSNIAQPLVKTGYDAHKAYFDDFFGLYKIKAGKRTKIDPFDITKTFNAPYKLYVQLSNDGSIDPADRMKVGRFYKVGVTVLVNVEQLRKKLEKDGIIRPLNYGF